MQQAVRRSVQLQRSLLQELGRRLRLRRLRGLLTPRSAAPTAVCSWTTAYAGHR
ncbi:hypothetical protein [Streptomyces sp. MK37H]|uniref:hypothetical protein n=1 Tax=Streptomyces sp. MK37H TaxID=2699117 RepID=UPI001B397346|nr:hypothetical protein [Streptomyces sp. MK37H]MBP8531684.1 hypothetical protein [Streptomyces sp. MK37H]